MRAETYENCTFTRFQSSTADFIENFFSNKVIHSMFLGIVWRQGQIVGFVCRPALPPVLRLSCQIVENILTPCITNDLDKGVRNGTSEDP